MYKIKQKKNPEQFNNDISVIDKLLRVLSFIKIFYFQCIRACLKNYACNLYTNTS